MELDEKNVQNLIEIPTSFGVDEDKVDLNTHTSSLLSEDVNFRAKKYTIGTSNNVHVSYRSTMPPKIRKIKKNNDYK